MKKIFFIIFANLYAAFAYCGNFSKTTNHNQSNNSIAALPAHAPLSFVENKGQITDQNCNPRSDIQFYVVAMPSLNIFIGDGAMHYQFSKFDKPVNSIKQSNPSSNPDHTPDFKEFTYTMYRMDVELAGANKNARVITEGKQGYYENYFSESKNGHGVIAYTYNRIIYKDIYPHIDWVLFINNGQLEHEFVVNEGGKVRDIQLKYSGATSLKLNADGSITAITPMGSITEQPPTSYRQQDGTLVKSNFKLTGDLLTYETDSYTGRLVVDPTLEWATYYGGGGNQQGYALTTDGTQNIYMTGWTNSTAMIATLGAYQTTYGGGSYDAFLAKFNSSGGIEWATYYGGSGTDWAFGTAIDGFGNVYITGYTNSPGIVTPGAYQDTLGGGDDAFLAKFSSAGAIQWATYYGGRGNEEAQGVEIDDSGNVYITGFTNSTTLIATPGAYQTTYMGGVSYGDAFIAKFNSIGAIQWATYYGGMGDDVGYDISADDSGNIYFSGVTNSETLIATSGAYQTTYGGGMYDAFIAKFNSIGAIQWATYYGGNNTDEGTAIALDRFWNVYITGFTRSTSNIATPGAYKNVLSGSIDAFLAKFNDAGAIQWATYYGGSEEDIGYGLAINDSNNVYITGKTNSTSGIATTAAYQDTLGDFYNAFLTEFSINGNFQYGTYYGGNGFDQGQAVIIDSTGDVYITGATTSTSGIATSSAYQDSLIGSDDAFLAKFHICLQVAGTISGIDSVCMDSIIILTDTTSSGIWSSSDTSIAIVTSGVVLGKMIGTDTIIYLVSNTCGVSIANKLINVTNDCTTAVTNVLLPKYKINVFPNPGNNELNITGVIELTNYLLLTVTGTCVGQGVLQPGANTVSMQNIVPGVYVLELVGEDGERDMVRVMKE